MLTHSHTLACPGASDYNLQKSQKKKAVRNKTRLQLSELINGCMFLISFVHLPSALAPTVAKNPLFAPVAVAVAVLVASLECDGKQPRESAVQLSCSCCIFSLGPAGLSSSWTPGRPSFSSSFVSSSASELVVLDDLPPSAASLTTFHSPSPRMRFSS